MAQRSDWNHRKSYVDIGCKPLAEPPAVINTISAFLRSAGATVLPTWSLTQPLHALHSPPLSDALDCVHYCLWDGVFDLLIGAVADAMGVALAAADETVATPPAPPPAARKPLAALPATPAAAQAGVAPDVTPAPAAVSRSGAAAPAEIMDAVRDLLTSLGLANYAGRFDDAGYDDVAYIGQLDRDGFVQLGEACGMKPGHLHKLQHHFRREK